MQKVPENSCQSCQKSDNFLGKYTSRAISPICVVTTKFIIFFHSNYKGSHLSLRSHLWSFGQNTFSLKNKWSFMSCRQENLRQEGAAEQQKLVCNLYFCHFLHIGWFLPQLFRAQMCALARAFMIAKSYICRWTLCRNSLVLKKSQAPLVVGWTSLQTQNFICAIFRKQWFW